MIENIITELNKIVKELGADGVKIYFNNDSSYSFKFIKDNKVIKKIKKYDSKFHGWDLKI